MMTKEDKEKNLEFAIQFCTTNLRYMLGEPRPFTEDIKNKIDHMYNEIERMEYELTQIR
jgi:hypothetical protein